MKKPLLWSVLPLALVACAPKIYVIERTTVLEEEAAGGWPELETRWKKVAVKTAPQAVKTEEASEKQRRLTRSLEPDSLAPALAPAASSAPAVSPTQNN